jgi:preprotein translocase subunit SecG
MITFILLGFFFVLAMAFAVIAWGANQRKRAGMKGTPNMPPTGTNGGSAMRH